MLLLLLLLFLADQEKPSALRKHADEEKARKQARSSRIQRQAQALDAAKVAVASGGAEVGTAFVLAAGMDGRPTASGDLFDSTALTASHPAIPLRSMVRVTNLDNGKAVIVRVNDRGGFSGDRIIGLTPRAAEDLGFGKAGHVRVRVEPVTGVSK